MGSYSFAHWLLVLIIFAVIAVPVVKILHRTGRSGWWCLLFFVPLVNLIGLWVFAFTRWPAVDD